MPQKCITVQSLYCRVTILLVTEVLVYEKDYIDLSETDKPDLMSDIQSFLTRTVVIGNCILEIVAY